MCRRIVWRKFIEVSENPVSYFSTLKLEAIGSSKTLLDLYQTTRRQIPEIVITELKYTVDVHKKINIFLSRQSSRDSTVHIATRLLAGRVGVRIPARARDLYLLKTSRPALGSPPPFLSGYRYSLPGVKRRGA